MPSTTSAPECPICLDKFRNPVAPPCGHLACDSCITVHARQSPNPYQATCPTCRAPFPTVLVDLSVIPKKYHVFVSQPLRRVYLGNWEDSNSQTSIDDLRLENATLNAHIVALRCENEIISRQLLATQGSFSRLIAVERDARSTIDELTEDLEEAHLALDEANEEAMLALEEAEEKERRANAKLAKLRAEYDALKAGRGGTTIPATNTNTKRTSGQAALDALHSNAGAHPPSSGRTGCAFNGRPIRPLPKRVKLRSVAGQADRGCWRSSVALEARGLVLPSPSQSPSPSPSPSPPPSFVTPASSRSLGISTPPTGSSIGTANGTAAESPTWPRSSTNAFCLNLTTLYRSP